MLYVFLVPPARRQDCKSHQKHYDGDREHHDLEQDAEGFHVALLPPARGYVKPACPALFKAGFVKYNIAIIYGDRDGGLSASKADVQIIVIAPDMFEMLCRCEMWLSTHPEGRAMMEACRAVIAKAKDTPATDTAGQ